MKTGIIGIYLICLLSLQACKGQPKCSFSGGDIDYLKTLTCENDFTSIQGTPLSEKYGQVSSVKLIYQLKSKQLYFADSKKYPYHHEFCETVLNDNQSLSSFNENNYTNSPRRQYLLANLNYYSAIKLYSLEFFNGDEITAAQIKILYEALVKNAPAIADKIRLLLNTPEIEVVHKSIPSVPAMTVNDIYKGQNFQTLFKGSSYGYLRIVDKKDLDNFVFGKHDIVVTNTIPNVLPAVAGVITVPFQTPLCHISILCANRRTPNAAYRFAFSNPKITDLKDKLVEFVVNADSFTLRDASADADRILANWKKNDTKKRVKLLYDAETSSLKDIWQLSQKSSRMVGGKAANMGELSRIKLKDQSSLPLPEGAFAIPFYWYKNHMLANRIQPKLDSILQNPALQNNTQLLNQKLKEIQELILKAPIDRRLLDEINFKFKHNGTKFTSYRFRSSTNAEDVQGFNGAGLYESKTAIIGDEKKTIEKAIKKVWASLWEPRAFAERSYFNFDQSTVFMGILVHRAFGTELANGVAITAHLYRQNYPAYTINAQVGETSVVSPPDTVIADQIIVALGAVTGERKISCEYISKSNISGGKPVLTQAQVEELVTYLSAIKNHYYMISSGTISRSNYYDDFAMDVEFKVDKYTGKIYIKQARYY